MVCVGEVDHRFCLVYSLEVCVEVLTGCDGEGGGELPDSNGIAGVERIDQDSIFAETEEVTSSKGYDSAAYQIKIVGVVVDSVSIEEEVTGFTFLGDGKDDTAIGGAVVNDLTSCAFLPSAGIVVITGQFTGVVFENDEGVVDEISLNEGVSFRVG